MIGELIGGIGNLIGGMIGQQTTNDMQMEMMQQQQQFQMNMSNTAYQRATQDMMKAGLNPMMMFGHGQAASTPPGASPSPMVKSGLDADSIQKGVGTAIQAALGLAQVKKLEAETVTELTRPKQVEAQTGLAGAQTVESGARTVSERQRPGLIDASTAESRARERVLTATEIEKLTGIPIIRNEALTAANQERMNSTARRLLDQGSLGGKRLSDTLRPVSDFLGSAFGVNRMIGNIQGRRLDREKFEHHKEWESYR